MPWLNHVYGAHYVLYVEWSNLLNLCWCIHGSLETRDFKISVLNKSHIFQCMGNIFCVEFQRYPLKFRTKCLPLILEDVYLIQMYKNNGDKGLVSTLVIHAPPAAWRVILGKLISCMIKHGHYAEEIILSRIVSLQKDARGYLCCSDNCRGIALSSPINKVVDWVILLKYKGNLRSSELQFA